MIPATYKEICYGCNRYIPTEVHHIFPGSRRKQCDKDGLMVYLCRDCHNWVHSSKGSEDLKKLQRIAQRYYEENLIADGATEEEAREQFIKSYIKSYL